MMSNSVMNCTFRKGVRFPCTIEKHRYCGLVPAFDAGVAAAGGHFICSTWYVHSTPFSSWTSAGTSGSLQYRGRCRWSETSAHGADTLTSPDRQHLLRSAALTVANYRPQQLRCHGCHYAYAHYGREILPHKTKIQF